MSDSERIESYASAMFEAAHGEGQLGEVEDELFRFGRALAGSDELRSALTDAQIPPARRQAIVEDLLGGKASQLTTSIVSFVVGAGRARDLPEIIDQLVSRAAQEKDKAVAEVRTAYPIDADQTARLAEALGKATGKSVEVKVIVDSSVLGGVVARIGDLVIDGSARRRLNQLKNAL